MATEAEIKALKEELITRARRKFPGDKRRQDRYVWGTIQKIKGGH